MADGVGYGLEGRLGGVVAVSGQGQRIEEDDLASAMKAHTRYAFGTGIGMQIGRVSNCSVGEELSRNISNPHRERATNPPSHLLPLRITARPALYPTAMTRFPFMATLAYDPFARPVSER